MKLEFDNENSVSDYDLERPVIEEKRPINRFILTSGLVHAITATAIIISNHVPQNDSEKDIVEIQVSSSSDTNSAPTIAPAAEVAAPASTAENTNPEMAPPEPPATPEPPPAVTAKEDSIVPTQQDLKPAPVAKVAQTTTMVPTAAPKPAPPATLDDIKVPELDDSVAQVAAAKTEENFKTLDLDQDLNKVDEARTQELKAASSLIDRETDKAENSFEESSQKAAEQIQKENEAAAAQIATRAQALRDEQAAREASAAAAALAKKNADLEAAAKKATGTGTGQKNAGPGNVSEEVRSLENLKQMPGNPRPQYDAEERLRGDQGVIVFQAFVTQDGHLTNFKLLRSTGHRNLDGKTLKILKQWKFYPGQEGWVELPFNWNLKGGPQEMPAFLRRKVGQGF